MGDERRPRSGRPGERHRGPEGREAEETGNPGRPEPSFAELIRSQEPGVRPLPERPPLPRPRDRPRPSPRPEVRPPRLPELVVERRGEWTAGRDPSLEPRRLARLQHGEPAFERVVDLHRQRESEARRTLLRAFEEAVRDGLRCLLVVHGRGRHSPEGPVLRERVPVWLSEPPLRARVLAFCSARPADGGTGAVYVLLRRNR